MSATKPKSRANEEDKDKGGVCGMSFDQITALQKEHITEVPLVINLLIDFIAAHGTQIQLFPFMGILLTKGKFVRL